MEPIHRPRRTAAESDPSEPEPARPPSRRRSARAVESVETGKGTAVILVGCGQATRTWFAPALGTLEQAGALHLHSVVDASESAREWGRNRFPQAKPLPSLDTVVAPPDALAVIATPARFHSAQANAALKRGWHVLCANPFATSAHEGALMIAAADRHERMLGVDLPQRFFPAARQLRTLCRDQLLGPLINFRIHEGTARVASEDLPVTGEKFESPDGVLSELGVPTLDLLTWCLGSASVKTYADDAMGGVEANAFIELGFSENVHGTVHLSRDWPTDRSYTFVFERGIVRWISNQPRRLLQHVASTPFAIEGELVMPPASHAPPPATFLDTPQQALVAELQNFLGAISGRESLRISATEAMHSLSVIEECYARRTPLPQPWLSQPEAVQARASAPPMALRRP